MHARSERMLSMIRISFMLLSTAAGAAAFNIFRGITHPLETALTWFLLLAFLCSASLSSSLFFLLCHHIRSRSLRLTSVPLFLAPFTFLCGFGVFAVSRLLNDSRPRSTDEEFGGALIYGNTSGIQMLSLDTGVWFYVIFSVALPLLLLLPISALLAFIGSSERGVTSAVEP